MGQGPSTLRLLALHREVRAHSGHASGRKSLPEDRRARHPQSRARGQPRPERNALADHRHGTTPRIDAPRTRARRPQVRGARRDRARADEPPAPAEDAVNIPALRVCHRFATLPYQEREHDVCVGELAVVMGWSPEHARVEMERMVVQGMLLHKCGDWYTVTDDGARVLKEDE